MSMSPAGSRLSLLPAKGLLPLGKGTGESPLPLLAPLVVPGGSGVPFEEASAGLWHLLPFPSAPCAPIPSHTVKVLFWTNKFYWK